MFNYFYVTSSIPTEECALVIFFAKETSFVDMFQSEMKRKIPRRSSVTLA